MNTFTCSLCKKTKPIQTEGGTGYAHNAKKKLFCYDCCGELDKKQMVETGRATLYLTSKKDPNPNSCRNGGLIYSVSNWPGTLKIECFGFRKGNHNIARTRTDVWFSFNQKLWHGTQYGENTQICHCKQAKA
jgi:hypothetical protein